jgi:hypothetical protein
MKIKTPRWCLVIALKTNNQSPPAIHSITFENQSDAIKLKDRLEDFFAGKDYLIELFAIHKDIVK